MLKQLGNFFSYEQEHSCLLNNCEEFQIYDYTSGVSFI